MTPGPEFACAGWVLAGGLSSRMGREKALLEISGTTLVVRAARLVASVCGSATIVGALEYYARFGFPTVPDDQPRLGPLGGILTSLARSETPWNLVVACDLPYLHSGWLRFLVDRAFHSNARVVLPESIGGPEPLCAVYHREAAGPIRAAIERGILKVTGAFEGLPVERVAPSEIQPFDPRGLLFLNLNTPEEYERARADLEGK
jgi:molybdopterin-guanine dinucleotide biosynthesis protein A